jgi:hypothetical protein
VTDSRPAPYPADTLARGWRFEVDMERFKRSDTWKLAKTGTLRAALLLLWAEAWQESPCGTLPNDDELIALTIDMPAATFAKHRSVLMRGWSLADDGRLYHDLITVRVLAMLEKRASDAQRAAKRRAHLAGSAATPPEVTDASRVTPDGRRSEFDTKHQAPSTRTEEEKETKPPRKRRGAAAALQVVPVEDLVAQGVDVQHAADWLAIRKLKDLPLTATAWDGVKAEAIKAGLSLPEAIKRAAENGWGGFKAKWLEADAAPARHAGHGVNKQEAIEERNRAVADEWLRQQEAADASS